MLKVLIVSIILFFSLSTTHASQLQVNTVNYAKTLVGTKEKTGNNDGKVVEEILGYIGLHKGNPYCMATVVFVYHKGAQSIGEKDKLPKYGRVSAVWKYAQSNPFKYKIITPDQILLKREKLQLGDIAIFSRSGGSVSNFNGHTGVICVEEDSIVYFNNVEGNTGPGAKTKDQGEGDGIWIRKRTISKANGNLGLKGFIRVK